MVLHLLRLPTRPLLLAIPLGLGLSLPLLRSHPTSAIRCDYGPTSIAQPAQQSWAYAQSPEQGSRSSHSKYGISATTARQISLGSVLGLLVGLGLRIFSRPLAFTIGLGILAVEVRAFLLPLTGVFVEHSLMLGLSTVGGIERLQYRPNKLVAAAHQIRRR